MIPNEFLEISEEDRASAAGSFDSVFDANLRVDSDWLQRGDRIALLVRELLTKRDLFWLQEVLSQSPNPPPALVFQGSGGSKAWHLPIDLQSLTAFQSHAAVYGGSLLSRNEDLVVAQCGSEFAVIAGRRALVEDAAGASLETRWRQFCYFASAEEPPYSVASNAVEYYRPFNGISAAVEDFEARSETFEDVVEPCSELPAEIRKFASGVVCGGVLDEQFLSGQRWLPGLLGGVAYPGLEGRWEWAAEAEWIAQAAKQLRIDEFLMVPVGDDPTATIFRVPANRQGLMAFEFHLKYGDQLLVPPGRQLLVYGNRKKYLVVAGPKKDVLTAMGGVPIEIALTEFQAWSHFDHPEEPLEQHAWLIDWCREHWSLA